MPKKLITILFLLTISMCANAQAAGQYVTKKPAQKTTQKSSQKSTQKSAQKTTQKSSQRQQTQKGNSSTSKAKGNNGGSSRSNSTAIPLCPDNHHPHMIDLGLPSGTKWACCNVGASKPEDYGGYFAWGETENKTIYDWNTYIHCVGTEETCHNIGSDIAGTKNDVVHVKWAGSWVMPSLDQIEELLDNCTYKWTTVNGVKGGKFTSKNNGFSIFLPAAGYRWNIGLYSVGSDGCCWSSTQYPSSSNYSYDFCFGSDKAYKSYDYRNLGRTVRPVLSSPQFSQFQQMQNGSSRTLIDEISLDQSNNSNGTTISLCPDDHHPHMIDLGLPSGTKWACCNVGTEKPEGYGGYYAWGETETKMTYDWKTYIHCNGTSETCHNIGSDISSSKNDVAHVKCGGNWQMPSLDQIKELLDNCSYKWTTVNGINGQIFTSKKNGANIFLPAAGYIWGDGLNGLGSFGGYWSSIQGLSISYCAYGLCFSSKIAYWSSDDERYGGHTVRMVIR